MKAPWNKRGRDQRDSELDEEIRGHFAMAVADRIARGEIARRMPPPRRDVEFGNVGRVKETTRETWGGVWIDRAPADRRRDYAVRSLRARRAGLHRRRRVSRSHSASASTPRCSPS